MAILLLILSINDTSSVTADYDDDVVVDELNSGPFRGADNPLRGADKKRDAGSKKVSSKFFFL